MNTALGAVDGMSTGTCCVAGVSVSAGAGAYAAAGADVYADADSGAGADAGASAGAGAGTCAGSGAGSGAGVGGGAASILPPPRSLSALQAEMFAIRAAALSELAASKVSLVDAVKALSPVRRARVAGEPKTQSPSKRSVRLIDAPKQFYGPGIIDEHGKVRPDTSEERVARDRIPRSPRTQASFTGTDVKAGAKSVRSSRVSYPMPKSKEPVCHWDRHKIGEEGRKGRQVIPLTCAVCNTSFCMQCVTNRFTSVNGAAADLADWTADSFWVCFVCTGECNCSGRGQHYFGRVARRPTGDLSSVRKANPTLTPNEFLTTVPGNRELYELEVNFPGMEPARFPHFRAGERHAADLDAARVRELKAAYPALVRTWVSARAARGAHVTADEADEADKAPTLEGWSKNWGLGAPDVGGGDWEKAQHVVLEYGMGKGHKKRRAGGARP